MRKFQAAEEQELLDGTIVLMTVLVMKNLLLNDQSQKFSPNLSPKYLKNQLLKSCLNQNLSNRSQHVTMMMYV